MDAKALMSDQLQIPQIDQQPGGLSEDKHGVFAVDRITQKNAGLGDTEIPEGGWDNAAFFPFTDQPLQDEPCSKQELANKSQHKPRRSGQQMILTNSSLDSQPAYLRFGYESSSSGMPEHFR
jgi:hypothetical protein